MPCQDNYTENDRRDAAREYNEKHRNDQQLTKLEVESALYQAYVCGIMNELEKRGIAAEVIMDAEKNGMTNLGEFWANHSKTDESAMVALLRQFSEHEIDIIRKLLKNKNVKR